MVGVKRALSSGSATSSAAEELSRGKRLLAEMEQQQQDGQAVEAEMRDKEIVLGNDGGHPYGIQPWGNSYSPSAEPSIRDTSLGGLRAIGDELLMDVLGMVGAHELCCLARTSRFLYVLAHMDELWRALVISSVGGKFRFKGSWRETYKACVGEGKGELPVHRPIKIKGVYSDSLFQPWLCASLSIPEVSNQSHSLVPFVFFQSVTSRARARAPDPPPPPPPHHHHHHHFHRHHHDHYLSCQVLHPIDMLFAYTSLYVCDHNHLRR